MNFNFNTPAGGGGPFAAIGGAIGGFIGLAVLLFTLYLWMRIFHKAGYSRWLAVLFLVPLVNFIVLIWFAFAHWPVEHEAMMARSAQPPGYTQQGGGYQPPGGYQQPGGYQPTPQH